MNQLRHCKTCSSLNVSTFFFMTFIFMHPVKTKNGISGNSSDITLTHITHNYSITFVDQNVTRSLITSFEQTWQPFTTDPTHVWLSEWVQKSPKVATVFINKCCIWTGFAQDLLTTSIWLVAAVNYLPKYFFSQNMAIKIANLFQCDVLS